jgi:hypothetical protein
LGRLFATSRSLIVATLERLSNLVSMLLNSPPRSSLKSLSSSFGGVALVTVEAVVARERPPGVSGVRYSGMGGAVSSEGIEAREFFLPPPNENVLPACLRKLEPLGTGGTGGI